jgi:PIN domain nuclease of toxin-antitoxin system
MPEEAVRLALGDIGLDIRPFDVELAYQAGILRTSTRRLGLSFGDRACLALGQQLEMPVFTTDRNWRALDIGVEIRVIR